jgi:hypothetical protein
MLDTTPVATAITRQINAGVAERDLVAAVARRFPDLDRREFVTALQDAAPAAERQAMRRH